MNAYKREYRNRELDWKKELATYNSDVQEITKLGSKITRWKQNDKELRDSFPVRLAATQIAVDRIKANPQNIYDWLMENGKNPLYAIPGSELTEEDMEEELISLPSSFAIGKKTFIYLVRSGKVWARSDKETWQPFVFDENLLKLEPCGERPYFSWERPGSIRCSDVPGASSDVFSYK